MYSSERLSEIAAAGDFECLNCAVSVTDSVTCNKFYINSKGDEITLSFAGCDFQAFITFPYAGDPDNKWDYWDSSADFVGKKFFLSGIYSYHQSGTTTRYQIIFNDANGIVWDH